MSEREVHDAAYSRTRAWLHAVSESSLARVAIGDLDTADGHGCVFAHGQCASPAAVGFESKSLAVWSANAGANPSLPESSPRVEYHVVLPPACISPVVQQSNQLKDVRSVSTTGALDVGCARSAVLGRFAQ
jgi:hypothetical protein